MSADVAVFKKCEVRCRSSGACKVCVTLNKLQSVNSLSQNLRPPGTPTPTHAHIHAQDHTRRRATITQPQDPTHEIGHN